LNEQATKLLERKKQESMGTNDPVFKLSNSAITHFELRGPEHHAEYYTIASGPTNEP
jgi:hypothetical protein